MRFYCTLTGPTGGLNCDVLLYLTSKICVKTPISMGTKRGNTTCFVSDKNILKHN